MSEFEEKRVVRKAGGVALNIHKPSERFVYELARAEDGIAFCCWDGRNFFRQDEIQQIDHIVRPPPEDKVTWYLPRLIEGEGNPPDKHPMFGRTVWDNVKSFIYDHVDFVDKRFYTYLTGWVFATWFQDRASTSPYPFFTGQKRTGKTRCLEVLAHLAFRAKKLASISGAAIRTNIRLLQPTLLIDEADFANEEKRAEIFPLLLSYRPDMYVERKNPKATGWSQLEVDPAFCFKAIASRKALNPNLLDRCVRIQMFYRSRKLKRLKSKESVERAERLRTELMELRLRYYWDVSDTEVSLGLEDDRVDELFIPPYLMAKTFAGEDEANIIYELAQASVETFKSERKRSDEADIIGALVKLEAEGGKEKVKVIGNRVAFSVTAVLEEVNSDRAESLKISARLFHSILSPMGFVREKTEFGDKQLRCVMIDKTALDHYKKLYEVVEPEQKRLPTLQECLELVKTWLVQNKDAEGLVDALALASYISQLGYEPVKIIQTLKEEYVVFEVPEIGKLGVR